MGGGCEGLPFLEFSFEADFHNKRHLDIFLTKGNNTSVVNAPPLKSSTETSKERKLKHLTKHFLECPLTSKNIDTFGNSQNFIFQGEINERQMFCTFQNKN